MTCIKTALRMALLKRGYFGSKFYEAILKEFSSLREATSSESKLVRIPAAILSRFKNPVPNKEMCLFQS